MLVPLSLVPSNSIFKAFISPEILDCTVYVTSMAICYHL